MKRLRTLGATWLCLMLTLVFAASAAAESGPTQWSPSVVVNNIPQYTDMGADSKNVLPGKYGSQYGRLLMLDNGDWLASYTIYDNNGYKYDSNGGNKLQLSRSTDHGQSWTVLATIADPGRDLDNAQMVQLDDGTILLACRSVIWQQSYKLDVYKSANNGASWSYLSTIDENSGAAGSLGNPDKGVYEPHMYVLDNGDVGVMYANEKHVTESPAYSQIISLKVSANDGASWGTEIWAAWAPGDSNARPGMPVWTKMNNGEYMLVFEVCGVDDCNVHYQTSSDGTTWSGGLGTLIPLQRGAPYVAQLSDNRLAIVSNTHNVSFSDDYGATWYVDDTAPYGSLFGGYDNLWASIYETGTNEIAVMTSAGRSAYNEYTEGHNVQIRLGTYDAVSTGIVSGAYYKITAQHSGKNLDVDAGSGADGAKVQQWENNDLPPQIWQFVAAGGGYYKIVNKQSGKLLEVSGGSVTPGASVTQWSDIGSDRQLWKAEHVGGGNYRIQNKLSGLNLDVTAGSTANGAVAEQWTENGDRPQRWKLVPVEGGIVSGATYKLTNQQSGLVMDVAGGSLANGANVQQEADNGSASQRWIIEDMGDGSYKLTNAQSGKCLDVDAGSGVPGANVQQWEDNGLPPERWIIEYTGSGYYKLTNAQSGLALDVAGGSMSAGGNIQQYTDNGLPPQRWELELQ
ncbi:RICIN domain-containing protein [Cohnella fermenti]|nr:RICIN domain-containing protein [Cohnella fermenti]